MKHGLLTAGLIISVLFVIINASYACPPDPPTAIIKALPEYVITGRAVTLDGSDSYPNPGIIEYRWDFDGDDCWDYIETTRAYPDGAFDGITTHAYTQAGNYTVKLLVIKPGQGISDIDTCTLHVCDDSDNDDLPDCWETLYGLDPDDPDDADEDDDSDGYNNLCEYLHLSEPDNDNSIPAPNYTIIIDVPGAVNSIQRAINACIDGDMVVVEPGRYVENLCFTDKQITLTSTDPEDPAVVAKTIIDGSNANSVIILEPGDADSAITGFTITNGNANVSIGADYNNGGGIYCEGVSPTISNCVIVGNKAYNSGGGCYFNGPLSGPAITPTITRCIIQDNTATSPGGGGMFNYHCTAKITDCIFANNKAKTGGGVNNNYGCSSPTLVNCVFTNNSLLQGGYFGGGMYNYSSVNPTVVNCTFSANSATAGGGVYNSGSAPRLTNCILWNNTATNGPQIHGGNPVVTYCCVEGEWAGEGNISSAPCFVNASDPAGPDYLFGTPDDGLVLGVGQSPCIDAGNNSAISGVADDIVGNVRKTDGNHDNTPKVDMGPYEVPKIWFVDDDKNGDGKSWANAYKYLQDALNYKDALNNNIKDGNEIWVAAGTYYPYQGPTPEQYRSETFQLVEDVPVYGGSAGTETGLCERKWTDNKTTLSGDIDGDEEPDYNSYHVVVGADKAFIDGFTITGGNADGAPWPDYAVGGGMYTSHDYTSWDYKCLTVVNCIFRDNKNVGMAAWEQCKPIIKNCVFTNNQGGGLSIAGLCYDSAVVANCVFYANPGGGMYLGGAGAKVTNCTFSKNTADYGGAVFLDGYAWLVATNCIFWGDITNSEIDEIYPSCIDVEYSCIDDGYPDDESIPFGGSANHNIDDDPDFVNADDGDGQDNKWATIDDGLKISFASPCGKTADPWQAPWADITGRLWLPEYNGAMGAYKPRYRIVVMCWINESSPYQNSSTYNSDLEDYNNLIASLDIVKSGCYVPPEDPDGSDPYGDISKVLPQGYPAPEEVTMDDFPGRGDAVLSDFTSRFDNLVQGGIVPDYVVLIVDNSGSMFTSDIEPHYSQATEDNFIYWIQTNYPNTIIDRRDDRYANPFENEYWLRAMKLQIENILEDL